MALPTHPVCSPGSASFSLSVTRPQAVSLPQVLSQMRLFSLAPYFRRSAPLTRSAPLGEGLTEQWQYEQRLNVGCTQERPPDPAVAGARRLWPGASPPPKKFTRQCSISISGIVENCNTHLAPGFTLNDLVPVPANVAILWGLLRPGGFNDLYQMSFQQWNRFSPCGLRTSQTPLCSWVFTLPTRASPGIELRSCSLCAPLVYSLNGI